MVYVMQDLWETGKCFHLVSLVLSQGDEWHSSNYNCHDNKYSDMVGGLYCYTSIKQRHRSNIQFLKFALLEY